MVANKDVLHNQQSIDFNRNRVNTFIDAYVSPSHSRVNLLKSEKENPKIAKQNDLKQLTSGKKYPVKFTVKSSNEGFEKKNSKHVKMIEIRQILDNSLEKSEDEDQFFNEMVATQKRKFNSNLNLRQEFSPLSNSSTLQNFFTKERLTLPLKNSQNKPDHSSRNFQQNNFQPDTSNLTTFAQKANLTQQIYQVDKIKEERQSLGKFNTPQSKKLSGEGYQSPNKSHFQASQNVDKIDLNLKEKTPNNSSLYESQNFYFSCRSKEKPQNPLKEIKTTQLRKRLSVKNTEVKPLNEYYLKILNKNMEKEKQKSMMEKFLQEEYENLAEEKESKFQSLDIKILNAKYKKMKQRRKSQIKC